MADVLSGVKYTIQQPVFRIVLTFIVGMQPVKLSCFKGSFERRVIPQTAFESCDKRELYSKEVMSSFATVTLLSPVLKQKYAFI